VGVIDYKRNIKIPNYRILFLECSIVVPHYLLHIFRYSTLLLLFIYLFICLLVLFLFAGNDKVNKNEAIT